MHGHKSVTSPLESQRKQRTPWRPWPASKDKLPRAQRFLGDTNSQAQNSPQSTSPAFDEYDAKLPPYFAQASPRGNLPRLNLAASMHNSPEHGPTCRPQMESFSFHQYAAEEHSHRNRKVKRDRGTHHSLDSLFETARHSHRRSLERGWCTERSHQLARETRRFGSRFAPDHPPSSTRLRLPGVDNRYRQRLHTPVEERSAGERTGHAGFVTTMGRNQLSEHLITPLLEMAVNSAHDEMQEQAPPALSALAGVAANRAVLGAYGAVEMMLRLAGSGKKASTKLDAWDTLHQLMLSSEAAMRFHQLGGVKTAILSSSHKDARVKRKAAMTMERFLSKETLSLDQRLDPSNIHALCKFVCCADPGASEAAGTALWSVARHSVKEDHPWPEESGIELARALVHDVEMLDEPAPANQGRVSKLFKGYTLTIKSLSLLVERHKGFRNRLGKDPSHCLALLYKSLAQIGAMMGRVSLESDLYYARTLATLGISTRTATMMDNPELIKWISASIPRLLFMLHESMPSHWNERRKKISRLGSNNEGILPRETEMTRCIALISNRNSFGIPAIRPSLVEAGFLPTLLELCTHTESKIRQNSASCLFYLLHEGEVQSAFGEATHRSTVEGPWLTLLSAIATSDDSLARMTLLRVVKQLCKKFDNMTSLHRAGLLSALRGVIELALAPGDQSPRSQKQAFPVLKNAFCATDLLLSCMEASEDIFQELEEHGTLIWLFKCCNDILSLHGALAWHAMEAHSEVRALLKPYARRHAQCHENEPLVAGVPAPKGSLRGELDAVDGFVGEETCEGSVTKAGDEEAYAGTQVLAEQQHASAPLPDSAQTKLKVRVGEILREIKFSVPAETSLNTSLRRAQETNIDKIRTTFHKYDHDDSDTIDGDELHGLLRDLGHLCTREEALLIMAGMDPNGDGAVDFAEFLDWWQHAPFSALLI